MGRDRKNFDAPILLANVPARELEERSIIVKKISAPIVLGIVPVRELEDRSILLDDVKLRLLGLMPTRDLEDEDEFIAPGIVPMSKL